LSSAEDLQTAIEKKSHGTQDGVSFQLNAKALNTKVKAKVMGWPRPVLPGSDSSKATLPSFSD